MRLLLLLAVTCHAHAQLEVSTHAPKIAGQKAILPLTIKNNLSESVESARAAAFLSDAQGKIVAQGTKWVLNGSEGTRPLKPGETNTFNFVVNAEKPFATTNLSTKVVFSRVVLEGGKLADPMKDVRIVSE